MKDRPAHFHANLMRLMDEPMRNALIAQADNVIDLRDRFEKRSVPWDMIDEFDLDDFE